MRMHRALGFTRRARRKRDDRNVFGRGCVIYEISLLTPHLGLEAEMSITIEVHHVAMPRRAISLLVHRGLELVTISRVGQRQLDIRLVEHVTKLTLAKKRHRTNDNSTSLDDTEPARSHHRIVRTAQQDSIPGNQAIIFDEDPCDPV